MTPQRFLLEKKNITPESSTNNVVIVMGLPGSGKTTLFQAGIYNVDNAVHLTPDNWIELLSKKENIDLKAPEKTKELPFKVVEDSCTLYGLPHVSFNKYACVAVTPASLKTPVKLISSDTLKAKP